MTYFRGVPGCVTKCDRGGWGSKLAKNSRTYFMDLAKSSASEKFRCRSKFCDNPVAYTIIIFINQTSTYTTFTHHQEGRLGLAVAAITCFLVPTCFSKLHGPVSLVFLLTFWSFKFNNCFAFRTRWCAPICHIYVGNRNGSYSMAPYYLVKTIDALIIIIITLTIYNWRHNTAMPLQGRLTVN